MQKLLDNLEIRNYRAFDHLVIGGLGQVNLFIGKNNVGKSSLLEAFLLYANLGAPHVILDTLLERDDVLSHRTINADSPLVVSQSVWNLFHGYPEIGTMSSGIEIGMINAPDSALRMNIEWFGLGKAVNNGTVLLPLEGDAHEYKGESIPALVVKQGTYSKIFRLDESLEEHARRWHLQPKIRKELVLPVQCIGPHGLKNKELPALWNAVALTGLKRDIIESLRIIDPSIDDIALFTIDPLQRTAMHVRLKGVEGSVPLKCLGDGMNRLFGLTLALVNAQNGMLLVDEMENGIHYSVLPFVWKFIMKVAKRLAVQVFATTHSMDCIRSFYTAAKDDKDMDGIATRIDYKNGEFNAVQFDEESLKEIIKGEIEIR